MRKSSSTGGREGSHDVVEESKDQSYKNERGGADTTRRAREGLCVSEHPFLLFCELLSLQCRAHHLPDGLVVSVEPVELKGGCQRTLK